jgi:hypothetical protein
MNKEASTNQSTRNVAVPIVVAEPQTCKLQQDKQENNNNNNKTNKKLVEMQEASMNQ